VLLEALRRLGRDDLTVHFRLSAERTAFPAEVREMALAMPSVTRLRRPIGGAICSRHAGSLLRPWGRFCATPAPDADVVVPLRPAG
jgi:hypothetical protein